MDRRMRRSSARAALVAALAATLASAAVAAGYVTSDLDPWNLTETTTTYGTEFHIATGTDGWVAFRWLDSPSKITVISGNACPDWSLIGNWTVGGERAQLNEKDGSIVYRFHARDLHLVLGPSGDGAPVRFRITIDGKEPGAAHGVDVDPEGQGVVTAQRLYQLVRDSGPVTDHTFEIEFLDPGVQAYAFTFG